MLKYDMIASDRMEFMDKRVFVRISPIASEITYALTELDRVRMEPARLAFHKAVPAAEQAFRLMVKAHLQAFDVRVEETDTIVKSEYQRLREERDQKNREIKQLREELRHKEEMIDEYRGQLRALAREMAERKAS